MNAQTAFFILRVTARSWLADNLDMPQSNAVREALAANVDAYIRSLESFVRFVEPVLCRRFADRCTDGHYGPIGEFFEELAKRAEAIKLSQTSKE